MVAVNEVSEKDKFGWLDEFLDAVQASLGAMDLSTLQPTSWLHFQPLVDQEWLDWFYSLKKECDEQKISFKQLAKAFPPGLCREHLLFTLQDLKSGRWPREKRLEIAEWFYKIIRAGSQGDYFGLEGSNLVHAPEQVQMILQKQFVEGSVESARALGRLHNAAYNLGAALYLDFYMGKPARNCGPYYLDNDRQLVVKQAFFLKPKQIWPDIASCAENIELFAIYQGTRFSVDFISCHSQFDGDAITGLKQWRLEVDGKPVESVKEIDEITFNIAENGKNQWKKIKQLSEKELIEKALWIRGYVFKSVCDLVGMDWRPTKEMLSALEGKTLEQGWNTWKQPSGEKEFWEYWRKMLDPRVEFYP